MDLMNYWSWILWIFSRLNKYLLGLLLECNLLFTASGTFSGGGGSDKSFSLVDSYLSASQNACCLLVLWAALNPCQERDLARPPVVPESPLGGGWEGGGLDNLSFTALIEKNFIMNFLKNASLFQNPISCCFVIWHNSMNWKPSLLLYLFVYFQFARQLFVKICKLTHLLALP